MLSNIAPQRTILAGTWTAFMLIMCLFIPTRIFATDFTAKSIGDFGNVTVMAVTGNYDTTNLNSSFQDAVPQQIIAQEFFKTHKDEYDFLVIFTNFNFQMPEKEAQAFYMGAKNDTHGIGQNIFDNTSSYGSNGRLQGTIDMGNISTIVTDPLDAKFEETLSTLSHELMHRWAVYLKLKDAYGNFSADLLGKNGFHWSFLLDTAGSLMYGNKWQDNGNGTFTSLAPMSEMKYYSPLDLYLMGMIDKSKVPPMLLIDSPGTDPAQIPQAGVTISGTARSITIDDIIAANGPRVPDASTAQKSFKSAFILVTQPGTFIGNELYGIENIRNGAVTRLSILTDGKGIMEAAATQLENIPANPGIAVPPATPRTLPPNINDGVQWLINNQKSDGSWGDQGQTIERDTASASLVLKEFSVSQPNYQNGVQWLGTITSGNMDFLARKIIEDVISRRIMNKKMHYQADTLKIPRSING